MAAMVRVLCECRALSDSMPPICDDVFDFLASIGVRLRHLPVIYHGYDLRKHSKQLAVSAESLVSLEVQSISKASVLSRVSLPKLVEVTIGSWLLEFVSVQDRLHSIDDDCFAQMDRIFSDRQFPALKNSRFSFVASPSVPARRSSLYPKLPALHASGRLLSSVTVKIENLRPQLW
ncbi:uncharacterized protein FIBRA_08975 [Fibroporia radiculosa]|uniref:Uncharacterized protein n=1 Tax=Fibroporia radiculosa TaxID=599839 RepID=J4GIM3_9APHY|nr:uncharacterized protein FIBRA_08975 [Fibroporia radiculosa]CCM06688.1 predicted protein [Fibroporia radiculosa]